MKKLSLALLLLVLSVSAWAQTKDTVRINVNGSEMIIITENWDEVSKTDFNAIIRKTDEEAKRIEEEHKRRMAEVDRELAAGEITEQEAEEERAIIAEDTAEEMEELAENIERWADEYGQEEDERTDDVDAWATAWETNAERYEQRNPQSPRQPDQPTTYDESETTVIIDEDGIHINGDDWDPEDVREAKRKYKGKKTHGYFEFYFGWNNWLNSNGLASVDNATPLTTATTAELNFWPSMTWGFGFGGRTRFGQSKFLIRYGAQFNWHYFQQKGDNILEKVITDNFDGVTILPNEELNVSKSTFRINYLDVPVMFEFDNSRPGRSNGFSLGLGGYGGIRLNSHTLVCYSDNNGDRSKTKTHNNFYALGYRYGAMVQIGFGTFKITTKYDLSPLFRDDKTTPDYQIGSVTFGWTFP